MYKSHTGGIGFEGMKGSWKAAEASYCESSGEVIGEEAVSVVVEGPGLEGSCKEVEAWHHEENL